MIKLSSSEMISVTARGCGHLKRSAKRAQGKGDTTGALYYVGEWMKCRAQ